MLEGLKLKPIWVAWRRETRLGKVTKVPYQISGSHASSTNPETWSTFEAIKSYKNKDGIGIVFEPKNRIVGIDFDHCLTPENIPDWLHDFIIESDSYCEFSPSKTGCHILFQITESLELEANKHYFDEEETQAVEVYTTGRYFTFSEDVMPLSRSLRTVTPLEFTTLLRRLGYPWKKPAAPTKTIDYTPLSLSDDALLQKMFTAKNSAKFIALYNGDASLYANDASSADYALCLSLAFWTQKNAEQMERIWLNSPSGAREKTANRQDYRERTIQNAIAATTEVYSPDSRQAINASNDNEEPFLMSSGKNPKPLLILPNIIRAIRMEPKLNESFRKNEFSHLTESNLLTPDKEWVPLTDDVISKTRVFISENYEPFRSVSKEMITDAILAVAYDNKVNPPRDYFTSLVWDKTPRLNSWLHNAYGVPDDNLHQSIASNWLKGLVKRVMIPGCQFDEVLALESPQGWRKSSSIRALGSPWHVETTHSIENKDFYLILAQNIIVEFSEGEIFDRASMKKIKAEITKTEDQVRPPYERGVVKFKRSCVFAVTTNELELKDDTGNRRWLPVTLEKVADVEWITQNRDQLFAEAYYRAIICGESSHEYPKEELETLQSSRAEYSDYDEKTLKWYLKLSPETRNDGISMHDAIKAVYTDYNNISKRDEMAMGGTFKRTLHLERLTIRNGSVTAKRWFPTSKTEKLIQESI